ncbi:hypothetical protein K7432_010691 [Basidiobolus ranarum]|uniref:ER-bound oxygenase mpaB/mpaB'/Rubber oxygenase catalytic domain-containing protein n=1 Tax=Basidiobolus ranarum TaxID=34480 RepID=A0ABR2WNA9_9FUNG
MWGLLLASTVLSLYLLAVRIQRFKRRNHIKKLGEPLQDKAKPHLARAYYEIYRATSNEFPLMMEFAFSITYVYLCGIPSINKLLISTHQFIDKSEKRFEDTDLLMREFMENLPNSERSDLAFRRINLFHSHYQIKNEDAWYLLGLYVFVPIDMIAKYEWRPLLRVEKEAMYQFWVNFVGRKLGFTQHIQANSFQEFETWFREYHTQNQVHHKVNTIMGEVTLDYFRASMAKYLKPLSDTIILHFCSSQVRHAIFFEPSVPDSLNPRLMKSWWMSGLIDGLLQLRRFIIRYFLLPHTGEIRRSPETMGSNHCYIPNWEISAGCLYSKGYMTEALGPEKFGTQLGKLFD